ncbi:hypothetical protein [Flavobacterium sp.]|nr:hypothetical protein [Flavobacterium sp.]
MKKLVLVGAIVFSLASCSSGWNCKARYVKSDIQKKKETHRVA